MMMTRSSQLSLPWLRGGSSIMTMMMLVLLIVIMMSSSTTFTTAYYLPGVNIHSFQEGQEIPLKVNKMTSTKTLLPLDYYKFPFCLPPTGVEQQNENLGEFLAGDRIENSPYILKMKKEMVSFSSTPVFLFLHCAK